MILSSPHVYPATRIGLDLRIRSRIAFVRSAVGSPDKLTETFGRLLFLFQSKRCGVAVDVQVAELAEHALFEGQSLSPDKFVNPTKVPFDAYTAVGFSAVCPYAAAANNTINSGSSFFIGEYGLAEAHPAVFTTL